MDQRISVSSEDNLLEFNQPPIAHQSIQFLNIDFLLSHTNALTLSLLKKRVHQLGQEKMAQYFIQPSQISYNFLGEHSDQYNKKNEQIELKKSKEMIENKKQNDQQLIDLINVKKSLKMFSLIRKVKQILLQKQSKKGTKKQIVPLFNEYYGTPKYKSKQEIQLEIFNKNRKFSNKMKEFYSTKFLQNPTKENLTGIIGTLQISQKIFKSWLKKHTLQQKRYQLINKIKQVYNEKNIKELQDEEFVKMISQPEETKISIIEFRQLARNIYNSKNFGAINRWCEYFIIKNELQDFCELPLKKMK